MQPVDQTEWQPPPPPEKIEVERPQMSLIGTLANIFFEPGRTFEDLRRKPRFIVAALILGVLTGVFSFALYQKVGDDGVRRAVIEAFDKNPQAASMPSEQKTAAVEMQVTLSRFTPFFIPLVAIVIMFLGGLLYWGASAAFGGTGGYLHNVSVFTYSSLPPAVVSTIANLVALIFKPAGEIDLTSAQRGVVPSNLSFLFGPDASPVLVTLVSIFDLFAVWGWILAAIGLRITNRISSGSAWAIIILIALLVALLRVVWAFVTGVPS